MRNNRIYTYILASLCWALVMVVILSWILGALFPESGIRTMLSGEAIRWLCSHFVEFCSSPLLVWLLLLAMSAGVFRCSGIFEPSHILKEKRRMAIVSSLFVTVNYPEAVSEMRRIEPHNQLWQHKADSLNITFPDFQIISD